MLAILCSSQVRSMAIADARTISRHRHLRQLALLAFAKVVASTGRFLQQVLAGQAVAELLRSLDCGSRLLVIIRGFSTMTGVSKARLASVPGKQSVLAFGMNGSLTLATTRFSCMSRLLAMQSVRSRQWYRESALQPFHWQVACMSWIACAGQVFEFCFGFALHGRHRCLSLSY